MRPPRILLCLLAALLIGLPLSSAQANEGDPVDPAGEFALYGKQQERAADYLTAEGISALATQGLASFGEGLVEQASDPERLFVTDACWSGSLTCAGDPQLSRWSEDRHGIVRTVHFTARNGATLSGRVWMTRAGKARRPLVVITPGSVQAPEQLYWWAAQTLAKAGYVVLTRDAQGQGRSDTFGEGDDLVDSVPSQTTGVTFFDHTQDALDFALSRPAAPYCPRPSRSKTSHCAKQQRRVAVGTATPYNPFWRWVDPTRIGLAGHSYGAAGVTWVGQQDRRVDAVVAWDNLCALSEPAPDRLSAGSNVPVGCLEGGLGTPRPRVPSLGISADYGLTPSPFLTEPDPLVKSTGSREFSAAGVDTGELVIRGGTHYEFSYLPTPLLGATLRGIDLSSWYTTAWMDRYVKGNRSATQRLLSDRWRHDAPGAEVDADGDGNLFSFRYLSRLDLGFGGGPRVRCEDLRVGCAALLGDGGAPYSVRAVALTADR